jgi:hypothetical protein
MQSRDVKDRPGPIVGGRNGNHGESFGASLKRLRESAGLTQEELSGTAVRRFHVWSLRPVAGG